MVIEVVLPAYNGVSYIQEQIASIYHQTLRPQRVLVRDDGSTDGTKELLLFLQQKYGSWLTFLPADSNLGCVANVNLLLENTSAQYVALADQDDIWLPDKLESSLKLLQQLECCHGRSTPLLIHTDLDLIRCDGSRFDITYSQHQRIDPRRTSLDQLVLTNVVTGCSVLMNKALLRKALPIPQEALMHDWWLALVACASGAIGYLQSPLVLYRQHNANILGAQGTGIFVIFKRIMRFKRGKQVRIIYSLIFQASSLQKRLQIREIPFITLMHQSRLLRIVQFFTDKKIRLIISKHGPLRTIIFRILFFLTPAFNKNRIHFNVTNLNT